uniref:3-hydroxyisobutyryl-CoA hydrolase n=1 Tax=Vitis vinifera TaxID=29760 RepID=F6GV68_VITVI
MYLCLCPCYFSTSQFISFQGQYIVFFVLLLHGRIEDCKECFRTVYSFIYLVGTYLNPNVAILDGITMGSRAGVSILGMFRVATDRTVFATPETLIGFHTDAGASFHLSHLPGYWGIETLDKCFSRGTVEEIIDALGVRARMVEKDYAPKVSVVYIIFQYVGG